MYAVDTVHNMFFFLGKYHPAQKIPQFRRYGITNKAVGRKANMLLLVKLRHIPLVHEDDILPLDSIQALKQWSLKRKPRRLWVSARNLAR